MTEIICPRCSEVFDLPEHDAHGLPIGELLLSEEDVDAIAATVIARVNGTMRVVIGDRTPKQYDRADRMAEGIDRAVRLALAEVGIYEPKDTDASTG